jgi:mycothiol synthase
MINIRPFDKEKDYPGLVALWNVLNPEYPTTEEASRHEDESRPSEPLWGNIIADKAGVIVGVGNFYQYRHDPRKFSVFVDVHPAHQRQGAGTMLYRALRDTLAAHQPAALSSIAREHVVSRMHFLPKLGFVETMREWESRLNPAKFDPGVLRSAVQRAESAAVEIRTFADLSSDPERERNIYELSNRVMEDVPSTEPFQPIPFEEFRERVFEKHEGLLPDAWFIALERETGKYVGMSSLYKPMVGEFLNTGLTGVLRDYRGRGIASALKLRAALYAKEKGISEVRTWNAQTNEEMLAINEKMGFVKQPAWVHFKKELTPDLQ